MTQQKTNKPDDIELVAFASVRSIKSDKTLSHSVITASTVDAVKAQLKKPTKKSDNEKSAYNKPEHDLTDLGRSVWHFYQQLKSFYEVTAVIEQLPDAFTGSYFTEMLLKFAEDNYRKIDDYDGITIYGLRDLDLISLRRRLKRWDDVQSGFQKLPSSILLSIVATFDSAFSDYIRALLRERPDRFLGSSKTYTVSQILQMNDVSSILDTVINDEIENIMSKSHSEQINFFEKSFGISIREHYTRFNEFIEIFERRNLAAHGDLIVNERYTSNCKIDESSEKSQINERLVVDSKYLEDSLDTLIEFGILLAFSAWHKQVPTAIEQSFYTLVEISFNLLTEGRPVVAERILEYGLKVSKNKANDEALKMMVINRAIALKTIDIDSNWNDVLAETDWSASNMRFEICAAAVKEDLDTIKRLLGPARLSGVIGTLEIRDWPVFRWMRRSEEFRATFEQEFGEALVTPKSNAQPTSDNSSNSLH